MLAVTHALETHKTVTGEDVEAIIEGRPGPLIDGRVYSGPEFSRVVEEYHAQAVSAHNGHGDFGIPLPVLGSGSSNGYATGAVQRQWARPGRSAPVTETRVLGADATTGRRATRRLVEERLVEGRLLKRRARRPPTAPPPGHTGKWPSP